MRPETTFLLDANVLIALADASHVHHEAAARWFGSHSASFATCPTTQGALLRMMMRTGSVPDVSIAMQVLNVFTSHPRHRFWADDLDYAAVGWTGVVGHRQITDAYLAALARQRGGKLASFDKGLAALHVDVVAAVPT
ncbi:MAG TPA: TA system VapC family ribonuclease toxin [Steroidobacteraceae bacterium]|nr:TA system VapC family ribonuclease toxin [Steroidobacteraceae bacterium]